ncbi:MAG: DNA sulfur modification protein DndD [Desulfobacteraceae bacterium]|nr:MAG: DNA sulfur modification protein DndD [Desulfobacteraceae bacterium]
MIFEEIIINNLFTYYGEQRFDLRGSTSEANIALISGRNGYGKTNFLNSIKLLFGGVTDSLRSSVHRVPGRKPSPNQYVVGVGTDWLGIMNTHARANDENLCGVQANWVEEAGKVSFSRYWIIKDQHFDMKLHLEADFLQKSLNEKDEEDIRRFIDERLPQSYIPFFFFDGEQIQEMVEANWNIQQQHMERLLNISPIDILIRQLGSVVNDWKREALDQTEKAELIRLENELSELNAQANAKNQIIDDTYSEILEIEQQINSINRKIEGMRAFRNQADQVRLRQTMLEHENSIQRLQEKIAEILPRDVHLYANFSLLERSVEALKQVIENENNIQSELLVKLSKTLPIQVFDMPPYPQEKLTAKQVGFYKERLNNTLLSYKTTPEHLDNLLKLDTDRSTKILDLFEIYIHSKALIAERAEDLEELRRINTKLKHVNEQLESINTFSAEEQSLYENSVKEKEQMERELTDKKSDLKKWQSDLKALFTEIERKDKQIEIQQDRYEHSQQARKKVDRAILLRSLFSDYKNELKKQKRKDIEEAINRYFPLLMTSHDMINKIEIGDDFEITYKDVRGKSIGMGSLSSGMKQLAATSLLWALKKASGKKIPLIIDTPLARIDLIHQENLLKHYYPNAGEQVIILPTDSELDERKYKILKPHIYQEYVLINHSGFKAKAVKKKMHSKVRAK